MAGFNRMRGTARRTAAVLRALLRRSATGRRDCRCGHPYAAHVHYRPGTECALCAADGCTRYRPQLRFGRATSADPAPDPD
jgi:hypothetical protein